MNCVDYFENTKEQDQKFVVGKEEVTYSELYTNSHKLANYLITNYGEGKNMLLLSVNNVFFITVYLAIIKSGNVCVPLDPKIEEENLNFVNKQSNPALAFSTKDVSRRLKMDFCDVLDSEKIVEVINSHQEIQPNPEFDEERISEIIFTSGSTGVPKGVMLSHKNLISNTESIITYLRLDQNDRMMVVMPFFYCYGLSLLHTHLRIGGSIVLNNSFIFLGAVLNDLKNNECTGFAGVPSHFQLLLRKSDSFVHTDFPKLKYVTQAGGKLPPVFIDEFKEAHPDVKFYVMYGQTEATARLSYLDPELYEEKKGSLGKGIPNVELKVVNKEGGSIAPGEVGEIIARGNNVMKGYINDPDGTNETLRNGWLYTGDLATIDRDGFIYHSARKKEIIKVGGKRISPKEIEEVILDLHEVVDCSINGISDELLGEAIKATIVVNSIKTTPLTEENVKEHCAKSLTLYKIPHIIEFEERMVLSSSGKKVKAKL